MRIEAKSDFTLICTFDTKEVMAFDVKPLLKRGGLIVEPLKSLPFFKKAFLEMGTPVWPNGFDICADLIYRKGVRLKSKSRAA